MKRVLITGGCGFIGSNLAKYLLDKGYEVSVVDDLSSGSMKYLSGLEVDLAIEDINNIPFFKADYVVHLAALTNLVELSNSPQKAWWVNANGTFRVLEYCRLCGIKQVVFASSMAIGGESVYGTTKLIGENICQSYSSNYGINTVCLRFSNVYGKRGNNGSVIPLYLEALKKGQPLIVYGDGNQTRDFVNVEDICQAIEKSLHHETAVMEVGTGRETSINALIAMLGEITHQRLDVVYKPMRSVEILHSVADIKTARMKLGYHPSVSLREGLTKLWCN